MVQYKVLKDAKDLKTGKEYRKDEVVEEKVKVVNDFEKRLKEKGYKLPFFERVEENKLSLDGRCRPFISEIKGDIKTCQTN